VRRLTVLFALSLFGCGSTEPNRPYALPNGRYLYGMEFQDGGTVRRYAGELVISESSEFILKYEWYVPGYYNPVEPLQSDYAYYSDQNPWFLSAYILGLARTALHTIARAGSGYSCRVEVVESIALEYTDGTCSVSYAGPDSVRR